MYALVEDNKIEEIINNPKPLIISDVRYPAKIFQLWTKEELEAVGLYEVESDTSNYKDENFYINTNPTYTFADSKVTKTWETATAKELSDKNAVDSEGNNVLDEDGNQVIIHGLKTLRINAIKQEASVLLEKTDWHNHKALDDDTYTIPDSIKTYRANVRTKSNEMETQINACSNVDELKALYEYTEQDDGTFKRPLAEFPKED